MDVCWNIETTTVCASKPRNLDGTKYKPTDTKTSRIKKIKAGKTKKQIAIKKSVTETEIWGAGNGCNKTLHCRDQKTRGTESVLWAGLAQKAFPDCSSRLEKKSFDEQES